MMDAPVVATGELIKRRPPLELLTHARTVGYVRHAGDGSVDRPVVLAESAQAYGTEAQLVAGWQAQLDLDVSLQSFAENLIEGRAEHRLIRVRHGGQLRLHGIRSLDAEDLVKSVIGIDDVTVRVDLKETDRNRRGKAVQQLLAGSEFFVCCHLL